MKTKKTDSQIRKELQTLFDAAYLLQQCGGVASSVTLDRYLDDQGLWRYSPHPLFDAAFYFEQNPDIVPAKINPLYHFVLHGGTEGRDPHILFDARFYRGLYLQNAPDENPLIDYLKDGAARGNKPYAQFDYELYRQEVKANVPNDAVLIDFALRYNEPSRQKFAAAQVKLGLCKNSRACPSDKENAKSISYSQCDVVIPVKDSVQWVAHALESIRSSIRDGVVAKVLLVDDGSSTESFQLLERMCRTFAKDTVELIRGDETRGFAHTCNRGATRGSAPLILLHNSDCLLTPKTISKMIAAFNSNPEIGLACPLSNNAGNVSVPMTEGASYRMMDTALESAARSLPSRYPEICTIVGHCLMISRQCFDALGGIDESWGLGYGEESDFHLRARAQGFLGVVVPDAYVYHFGGGTFRNLENRSTLQSTNHRRFMELWGESFSCFYRTVAPASPVPVFSRKARELPLPAECDVLFILPGLTKGVGGVQVVIDLCNFLISRGVDARVVILGAYDQRILAEYTEPLYFNPYHAPNDDYLINELRIRPKVVVATLFATAPAAYRFSKKLGAQLINFVQGYELYFADGVFYEQARDSYFLASQCMATSGWLVEKVTRHAPHMHVEHLPLGIDRNLFYPEISRTIATKERRVRVGMVIRSAADKGQFVLREICDLLLTLQRDICLTVFVPRDYAFHSPWEVDVDTRVVRIPIDRVNIAKELRQVDIFVDASLHEGYGLFPLEAMASGACVVASDSGGVSQFLENDRNGVIVSQVNKPEAYVAQIRALIDDRQRFVRLRDAALSTVERYDENDLFEGYREFFLRALEHEASLNPVRESDAKAV